MSNALSQPSATAPASALPAHFPVWMYTLVALGLCVLIAWIIACLIRRRKFVEAAGPGRRSRLNVLHIILPMLCTFAATGVASYFLPHVPPYSLITMAIGTVMLMAASLVAGAYGFPLGLSRGMGLSGRHWLYDSVRGVLGYLGILPVCMAAIEITTRLMTAWGYHSPEHPLLEILRNPDASRLSCTLAVVTAVILAPLTEEIFYRGLLQTALRRQFRPWPAIVLTALLFSFMHIGAPSSVPAILVFGMALGYQYERTGRLWAPVVMHVIFNAVFVTLTITTPA
ncbi:MAG: CPBP family intramembrane metalloprotease [Planctomycetaceae bacterium]|nr:CPBP family intramembrane metalloprotease [Planctomycetaceae bacterium]